MAYKVLPAQLKPKICPQLIKKNAYPLWLSTRGNCCIKRCWRRVPFWQKPNQTPFNHLLCSLSIVAQAGNTKTMQSGFVQHMHAAKHMTNLGRKTKSSSWVILISQSPISLTRIHDETALALYFLRYILLFYLANLCQIVWCCI